MCGRFVSSTPPDALADFFDVEKVGEKLLEPSYNVAPTNDVYVVRHSEAGRALETMRWGLVPFWAKDTKIGNRMINARAETVAEKPAFRRALAARRCLIPADGFYEWKKSAGGSGPKQPYYIHLTTGEPMAFAGLWERWHPKEDPDSELRSCTIITTRANDAIAELHDRMPVILPPQAWSTWLEAGESDIATVSELLEPCPTELITFHPVSRAVNSPRSRGAELIAEVDPDLEDHSAKEMRRGKA